MNTRKGIRGLLLGAAVLAVVSSCGGKQPLRPAAAPGPASLPAAVPDAPPPAVVAPDVPPPAPPQVASLVIPPRIDVVSCRLAANDEFVEVRFRLRGKEAMDPLSTESYLLDEATGDRFYAIQLQRLGRIAEDRPGERKGVQSLLFKNREGKLRPGQRLTLSVGSLRRENVLLEK